MFAKSVSTRACGVLAVALLAAAFALACALQPGAAFAAKAQMTQTTSASTAAAAVGSAQRPLADGDYVIRSLLADRQVLDVSGGSKANGANVQLYAWNGTGAQKWRLKWNQAGYYTITNIGSGKALDVAGAGKRNGTNVHMYAANNTLAQRWVITKSGGGYRVASALKANFALDIAGANSRNGANAQVYAANGTKAQQFAFVPLSGTAAGPSTADIAEGAYVFKASSGKVLDVNGASLDNCANVQQYAANGTYAQRFYIQPDGNGYYRIFNLASGLALDVNGADVMPGGNVQQYAWNGTAAQLWSASKNADGTYTFASKCSGNVLQVVGNTSANGANVVVNTRSSAATQRFTLQKAELLNTGAALFSPASATNRAVNLAGGSEAVGAKLEVYDYNATNPQRFVVGKSGSSYTLRNVRSGRYVACDAQGNVVQAKEPYAWNASYSTAGSRRGVVLVDPASGKAVNASSTASGTALKLAAANRSAAQALLPRPCNLVADGTYTFRTALGTRVLDVAGGSSANSANIQLYASNNSSAQKFQVLHVGGGYYRILNSLTGKALDVKGASRASGANVQQYTWNNTAAQLWKPEFTSDGYLLFRNKASGNVLDVAAGKDANGANVDVRTANGSAQQGWRLVPTSGSTLYDDVVRRAQGKINGKSSSTKYFITVDLSNHRVVVFTGSKGNWTPLKSWVCTNGASGTPTVVGDYTIGSRGYSFDGSNYTCYYWTQFYGDYLFHSVIYRLHSDKIKDGTLGDARSHGCVRLAIENAKWINQNIPSGTHVYTYY